jgi:hypothetical protein
MRGIQIRFIEFGALIFLACQNLVKGGEIHLNCKILAITASMVSNTLLQQKHNHPVC